MSLSAINVGGTPNDGTGDTLRTAFVKVNTNFDSVAEHTTVPATANSAGSPGQISWDTNYIYVCTSTDTWFRSSISSW